MHDMTRRNFFDEAAARKLARVSANEFLDISRQVQALHQLRLFVHEIVDCIHYGLMRRNPDGTSRHVFDVEGPYCMIQYVILEDRGVLSRESGFVLQAERAARLPSGLWQSGDDGPRARSATPLDGGGMALAERGRQTDGSSTPCSATARSGRLDLGGHHDGLIVRLFNLIAVVDNNDLQSLGRTSETHPSF